MTLQNMPKDVRIKRSFFPIPSPRYKYEHFLFSSIFSINNNCCSDLLSHFFYSIGIDRKKESEDTFNIIFIFLILVFLLYFSSPVPHLLPILSNYCAFLRTTEEHQPSIFFQLAYNTFIRKYYFTKSNFIRASIIKMQHCLDYVLIYPYVYNTKCLPHFS